MRKVLIPAALSLSILLSACGGGGTNTPTVATVDLTGDTNVAVGTTPKLSAVAKDASGNTITSTISYSSDQPNVIAVDSAGNLTVKRLSAANKPVTITATAGSVSDTLQITTHGLEMALGTENSGDDTPGLVAVTRFRPKSGQTENLDLTITSPNGNQRTCSFAAGEAADYCRNFMSDSTKYPNGEYTASMTQGGVTYTTKASITSRSSLLPVPQNVVVTNSGRTITWNAQAVPGAALYLASFSQSDSDDWYYTTVSLPITRTLPNTSEFPAGTYTTYIDAFSFNFTDFNSVLPEQVNNSYDYGDDLTIPAN